MARLSTAYHKQGHIYYLYVDYDPPNYLTIESKFFRDLTRLITTRITPAEGGSKFEIYYGRPYEEHPEPEPISLQEGGDAAVARFAKIINEEIEAGNINPNQTAEAHDQKSGFGRPAVAQGRFAAIRSENTAS